MSTRRARIKAVASLPRRRKVANVESKPEEALKNDFEKEIKSPRPNTRSEAHASSPAPKPRTPARTRKTPIITAEKPAELITNTPTPVTEKSTTIATPNDPGRVPVITSSISIKSFLSTPKTTSANTLATPGETSQTVAENNEKSLANDNEVTGPKTSGEPAKDADIPNTLDLDKEKDKGEGNEKDTQSVNKEKSDDQVIQKADGNKNAPNVAQDSNTRNTSENIIDDPMDGIVPLQPAVSRPKPIAALKNEIISENAEVLFDPIVPLPSPSKIRPKLRPVPRLAPLRRNSIQQGSASESEDESRRHLHLGGSGTPASLRSRHDSQSNRELSRNRNDSMCSSASQATGSQVAATSPVKEKAKSRRQEMSRKMAAMRRRKETVKRDQLTMYDLIFYNPTSNPIVHDDESEGKEVIEKDVVEDIEADEEDPDEPEAESAAPVPQIKLGPNGEIMLDEQSLVIKQSSQRKVVSVVREGPGGGASRSYRRTKRTADWPPAETVRFYRALAAIGTDFSLMEPLFPGRTRRDLKLKFKKEEKVNCAQVDKAIRSRVEWNALRLIDEFTAEREEEARKQQEKKDQLMKEKKEQQLRKQAAKELRVRHSRSAKTLGNSIMPPAARGSLSRQHPDEATTADEIIANAVKTRKRRRQNEETVTTPNPTQQEPGPKIPIPANPTPQTHTPQNPTQNNTPQYLTPQNTTPQLPTLTLIKNTSTSQSPKRMPELIADSNDGPCVTPNVEDGSLVVLSVNDPNSPSKKMLQTYIAHGSGKLKPIALNPALLSSVVGYMKRSTPRSTSSARSSPILMSPSSVTSADSKEPTTPGVIVNPSPSKKSNYSITPL